MQTRRDLIRSLLGGAVAAAVGSKLVDAPKYERIKVSIPESNPAVQRGAELVRREFDRDPPTFLMLGQSEHGSYDWEDVWLREASIRHMRDHLRHLEFERAWEASMRSIEKLANGRIR